jgi:hypothetical protein
MQIQKKQSFNSIKKIAVKTGFFLLFISVTQIAFSQRVRYVNAIPSGRKDGSSWENASSNLRKIINSSAIGDQVFIAIKNGSFDCFNLMRKAAPESGVKSYLIKVCNSTTQNNQTYFIVDPSNKQRIPKYSFQVIQSKSIKNPPLYLALQII